MELDRFARRLLIVVFSCFFIIAIIPRYEVSAQQHSNLSPRQAKTSPATGGAKDTSVTTEPASTSKDVSTSAPLPSSVSSTSAAASTSTSESATKATSTTPTPTTSTTAPPVLTSSAVITTNSAGETVTETAIVTASQTSSAKPSGTSAADAGGGSDSKGLGTGSIVGLSVAGGVALIGIVGFFVWKFTRKRFSDFDDNEAIKWPELNTHGEAAGGGHALPVNNTGRAGFETGSEASLSRPASTVGTNFDNYSASGNHDPYAVPPLPHLNPNQPYRDDPGAYYDPYNGPVPNSFEAEGGGHYGGEAIPMTQIAGRRSPGPGAAYDGGRRSPGPGPAYDAGRRSPGPGPAYDAGQGRRSPGPQAAYGQPGIPEFSAPQGMTEGPRARSPGPAVGLGGGRRSPGPQAAYDSPPAGYGQR